MLDSLRRKWKTKLINWPAFLGLLVLAIAICIGGAISNRNDLARAIQERSDLQVTLSKTEAERNALKKQYDSIGSKPYLETRARDEDHYLREDEIRFVVENPDMLDNYTDEELNILINEMATLKR